MLRFMEKMLNTPFTPSDNALAKSYSRKELTRKIAEILGA